ncbi:MAG TPA: LuxR C-terminal-related transcriptional regulator [Ktedonobacteraceae bacterium]|jgi:LuxR family maltose regulon positive regulatory protein|nr:LuxR C-terminal-related transcriptional regulator [Ktedonobacteraceae bacterium]
MNVVPHYREEFLSTKFFVPVSSHPVILRHRLTEQLLNASLLRPITLISAPAGFGKTTLVATWVQSLPEREPCVAWVSLDEGDNDTVRFWSYVLSALEHQLPGHFSELLALLQQQTAPALQSIIKALINILAECQEQILLVLDDYHLITEQAIHALLTFFIEHLPPCCHLLIATRVDPPLPLSRLRGRDQMLEIHTEQLRCTPEEAMTFLNEVLDISLSESAFQQVFGRTEGWLVGLQLLGLILQGHNEPGIVLEELSGSQHYILDYLTDEVLAQQSEPLQHFLLYTSILDQLSAPLCDALLQETDSQKFLEELERHNLFLVALDSERRWYRYHNLFAGALRTLLKRKKREMVDVLLLRASSWYLKQGNTREAIEYALRAHAWSKAAEMIEEIVQSTYVQCEPRTIRRWIEAFPLQEIHTRPQLCLAYAQALKVADPLSTQQERWLLLAENGATALLSEDTSEGEPVSPATRPAHERLLAEVLIAQATLAVTHGDDQKAQDLAERAYSYVSPQHGVCARLHFIQGYIALFRGQSVPATQQFLDATRISQNAGNAGDTLFYQYCAATTLYLAGKLHAAWQLFQQIIEREGAPGNTLVSQLSGIYTRQADILREWDRLDEALALANQSRQYAEDAGLTGHLHEIALVQARIFLAQGKLEDANALLEQAQPAFEQTNFERLRTLFLTPLQIRLWLARGEEGRAQLFVRKLMQSPRPHEPFVREREDIARARVALALAQPDETLSLLAPLFSQAESGERIDDLVEMLCLEALAWSMQHQEQQALTALARAVRVAEPEGFIRSFVEEGISMKRLLMRLREQQQRYGSTPYLDSLLAAFQDDLSTDPSDESPQAQLLDPLSEREREVLQLVALGKSNQEIAERLVIAVDTVKRHMYHIYNKLGVKNRVQVVARAHDLDLLSGTT